MHNRLRPNYSFLHFEYSSSLSSLEDHSALASPLALLILLSNHLQIIRSRSRSTVKSLNSNRNIEIIEISNIRNQEFIQNAPHHRATR